MSEFRFLTAGESHGRGLVAIVDGMVAGLAVDEEYITRDLRRRQGGHGRGGRMAIERDTAEIISGVRHGLTTGSPISILVWNKDWENWKEAMAVGKPAKAAEPIVLPRPGHADLAGAYKYGLKDIRPILERSSARETVTRVAAGAIARRFLEAFGIVIHSHTIAIGGVTVKSSAAPDWRDIEASPVRCGDVAMEPDMVAAIDAAKAKGDTLGGVFEVVAAGLPVGLGSHVQWDRRLDGRIAQAVMSIPSVKGVEIGAGFELASLAGSAAHDVIEPGPGARPWLRATNRAGGLEGGISNGEPLVVRAAVKPIATLMKPLASIDLTTGKPASAHVERSDVCIVPAAGVIGEAMVALCLAAAVLEKFGGDNLKETLDNCQRFVQSISLWKADEEKPV